MKKILITGGNGFIGRNLKEYLNARYDISAPSHKELELCDSENVTTYLSHHRFDVVIHAANTNNTRNKEASDYMVLDRNLRMFFNLKRNAGHYGKMYYFGSGAEYDREHYQPMMKEEYFGTYVPKDPYGFSKYIMANSINDVDNIFDLRLFGVYGKYEEWERRFISNNICRILNGLPASVNQNMYFDYLYVDDLCEIMAWFIENEPKFKQYNLCTGKRRALVDIASLIKYKMLDNKEIQIKKDSLTGEYTGNNSRLLSTIGNYQFSEIEENIDKLIKFYGADNGYILSEK